MCTSVGRVNGSRDYLEEIVNHMPALKIQNLDNVEKLSSVTKAIKYSSWVALIERKNFAANKGKWQESINLRRILLLGGP